jgi:monofunctional biosynthetic peptidoglycan transglycosylase
VTAWRRTLLRVLLAALLAAVLGPPGLVAVLRWVPPLLTPTMAVRALADGAPIDYRWTPLAHVAPDLVRAVIAAEDTRFVHHRGFDWTELRAALRAHRRGRRLRGASTISMQCARNLFLLPHRSLVRKLAEAYLTVLLEALWPKRRILEVYVNVVEWSHGVYGCEAAARRTFGVSCAGLDARQAALLAATLPSPRRWSAARPGPRVLGRASTILRRMRQVEVPR